MPSLLPASIFLYQCPGRFVGIPFLFRIWVTRVFKRSGDPVSDPNPNFELFRTELTPEHTIPSTQKRIHFRGRSGRTYCALLFTSTAYQPGSTSRMSVALPPPPFSSILRKTTSLIKMTLLIKQNLFSSLKWARQADEPRGGVSLATKESRTH